MPSLLHISVSPRGDRSRSNQVGRTFVDTWRDTHPGGAVVIRDLANEPPSFVNAAWFEGAFAPPEAQSPAARTAMAESDHNIEQLLAADEVVLTTPLFNLGVPASLKAWIDQIVRVGRTFTMREGQYAGLVADRRVTVIVASGGDFQPGSPAAGYNFLEPYLRAIFGFIGITSVHFVYAPNQNVSDTAAAAGLAAGHAAARQQVVAA